jgi:ribosomal protein S18 acetylase RimI-like enzyme
VGATIKRFDPADRGSLSQAIDAVCSDGHWMSTIRFEPTPSWTHALEVPACPHHRLLVAEDGGQVVGWCRLFPLTGCDDPDHEAEVGIGLLPQYRGRGLGKALLNQVLDWAAARKIERVRLCTRMDNTRAIHLFQGCGFIRQGHETDGWLEMMCQLLPSGG